MSTTQANRIEDDMIHPMFPWYFIPLITYWDNELVEPEKHFQFVHSFFFEHKTTSQFFNILDPIVEKLKAKSFIRIKANCITMTDKHILHGFHNDYDDNVTAIYYVNTNNGYTMFESGEKIPSVQNQLATFDGNQRHCSVVQTDTSARYIININIL